MYDLTEDHCLVVFFEMNQLKVEFFDCENYMTTIDDLIVALIEALNYDSNHENSSHNE
eukprot:CAMPEP_0202962020 /NCGR_PEP_ID=MMETSP1396-20130829/6120_1 /ASSEMBLY_ACC=CAM_ASM_000872 /TAXON_ID= /ORGANISM="Pseudokeronopsis sp., Strain Brazil" /LENGTH=57 /DNA_ID=CAMNT_0049682307 /DNA_START=358 /DNA_END=531 /DNA_ORIENTATION=-